MKYFSLMIAIPVFCIALTNNGQADIIYRTGTHDAMELDFDGTGTQTSGNLGITSKGFTITGGDLPTEIEFADITSITIDFQATSGNFSANNSAGSISGGLGISSFGEGTAQSTLLSPGSGEMITINVSSTSTDPTKQVMLSGMKFSSWRNAFPVSQFDLTGAMINGNDFYIGNSGAGTEVSFDTASNSITLESVSSHATGGGDGFRLHQINLAVTSVPEPGSMSVLGLGLVVTMLFRRRQK